MFADLLMCVWARQPCTFCFFDELGAPLVLQTSDGKWRCCVEEVDGVALMEELIGNQLSSAVLAMT